MSQLHDFDTRLCDLVIANVRWHLDNEWIFRRISGLEKPLKKVLIDESADNVRLAPLPRLLLNDDELDAIEESLRFPPMHSCRLWDDIGWPCEDAVFCTREIRARLAAADAERWSAQSRRFHELLQSSSLLLSDGVKIVHEWVGELRRYLEALCEYRYLPRPIGGFPTPTHPTSDTELDELINVEELYVQQMEAAISKHPDGENAPAKDLIKMAGISNRHGRNALRTLEERDKYSGFARRRPARYSKHSG
jgi:hypothetical protein